MNTERDHCDTQLGHNHNTDMILQRVMMQVLVQKEQLFKTAV